MEDTVIMTLINACARLGSQDKSAKWVGRSLFSSFCIVGCKLKKSIRTKISLAVWPLNQRPVWRPPDWWEPTPLQAAHRPIQLLAPTSYAPDPHKALFGSCSLVESEQCYFCQYFQAVSWQVMAIDISANYRNESGQVYPTTWKSLFDSKAFISITSL